MRVSDQQKDTQAVKWVWRRRCEAVGWWKNGWMAGLVMRSDKRDTNMKIRILWRRESWDCEVIHVFVASHLFHLSEQASFDWQIEEACVYFISLGCKSGRNYKHFYLRTRSHYIITLGTVEQMCVCVCLLLSVVCMCLHLSPHIGRFSGSAGPPWANQSPARYLTAWRLLAEQMAP